MPGKPEIEYSEALSSHRHYSNLRYTILGVFAALFVGVVALAAGGRGVLPDPAWLRAAQGFLLLLSVAFWAFEEGIDGYLRSLSRRVIALEASLDYALFSSRPRWANWLAIPATRAPYLLGILLSIAFLLRQT